MIRTAGWMLCAVSIVTVPGGASAQPRYDDVVRNLRNPDAKVRLNALRLLREARHIEAIGPIAPLVNDPVDDIQLEAIATELSFYLVEDVPASRRVALVFEVRSQGQAPSAFELGPLAVWPRPVPAELISSLLQAVDDENGRVRTEAIYALGVIARPPLAADHAGTLIKALDHYDPAIRAAVARVAGRLQVTAAGDALIKTINDSKEEVRFAAMRALGDLREARAVESLGDQLTYYERGEGAWSALHALARIAHPSSIPIFKARLGDRDPAIRRAAIEGLGRTGDRSEETALQQAAGSDPEGGVRAAAAFALQLHGGHYIPRLVEAFLSERTALQVRDYLRELGPGIEQTLLTHLIDQDPAIRGHVARVLGEIGGEASRAALQPLLKDRDRRVAQEAAWALDRMAMRAEPSKANQGS